MTAYIIVSLSCGAVIQLAQVLVLADLIIPGKRCDRVREFTHFIIFVKNASQ